MIRDEFLKKQQDEKLTTKELAGIRAVGERAYYTSALPKINSIIKSMNLMAIILFIMAVALTAVDVYTITVLKTIGGGFGEWFSIILPVILYILVAVWVFFVKKRYVNRYKKYQNRIKLLTQNEMQKQQKIYNKIKN